MLGAGGAGITIGAEDVWSPVFWSSLMTMGAACGAVRDDGGGKAAGHGRGIETTMDSGGPAGCTTMGGGPRVLFGRFTNTGPGAGPGTTVSGGGDGKGGNRTKTVFDDGGDDDNNPSDGGGRSPEDDSFFSRGNNAVDGKDETQDGATEDTAAMSTRRVTGESSSNVDGGNDVTALRRAASVGGDNVLNNCGVADSAFVMDTSVGGGRR